MPQTTNTTVSSKCADVPLVPAETKLHVMQISKPWLFALLATGMCWLLFFNELRGEWAVNAQYSYGYVVPLLALALWWRRWPDRPEPAPESSVLLNATAVLAAALLLPLRIALEANPEWRLLYWIHGGVVLVLSFWLVHRIGGWHWVRCFFFPLVFTLIAIPWPMEFERWAIQNLMRFVAALTVEVAGWLNIPAVQHGNLIEVGVGVVGIDEACSGVRSLQSALMLSLFLGEMHRFAAGRRVALIVASLGFVLLANLVRTVFLTWAAANHGLHQMEQWHDAAGMIVMFIVLPSLMGLAYVMRTKNAPERDLPIRGDRKVGKISPWYAVALVVWIGITELATAAWYRVHETDLIPNTQWSVAWPTDSAEFKKAPLPENSVAILRCSNSESATWKDDEGNEWKAFFLRWNPGKNSSQLAKGHRPDICFPAAGAKLVEDLGQINVTATKVEIPFRHQTFENNGGVFHVFYCLWSDRISKNEKPVLENGSQESRLEAVLAGKRHLGQQVLEVVIAGPENNADAVVSFRKKVGELIRIE